MVKKLFFAIILVLLCVPGLAFGQRNIGVTWQVPNQPQKAEAQLKQFIKLGVSYLQINQRLNKSTWQWISKSGLTVFGKLPVKFPLSHTFSEPDSILNSKFQDLIVQFNTRPSVKAIGIFSYGDESDIAFQQNVKKFLKKVKSKTSKPLYYVSAYPASDALDPLFDFKILSISPIDNAVDYEKTGAFLYRPPASNKWGLAPIKKMFQHTARVNRPVFFESLWLQKMLKKHPDFARTLSLQARAAHPAFPLPKSETQGASGSSIIALMLLLLWIIFAVTYNFSPLYHKSFLRYFTGHSFFVKDVMKRHIRNFFIGFSILIQHSISGGIIFYCLFYVTFTSLGHEVLYTYYPVVAVFGTGKLAFLLWGCIAALIMEAAMVIWLWIANPKANAIGQIINLYPWPLQLNLIIATLTAAIFLSYGNGNTTVIYLLGTVFFAVFNSGIIITCFDMLPYTTGSRSWYLAGMTGIYYILLIALISWILTSTMLHNVIDLAVSLP